MSVPTATLLRKDLRTATSIAYRRQAEDQLDQATLMHMWGEPRPLERGRSDIQLHRFDLGAQNMRTLTEGEVGAGTHIGDNIFSMRPSHYGDFSIVSDEVMLEVYSNYRKGVAQGLGSRAALTIDAIHKLIFDGGSADYTIQSITPRLTRKTLGQVATLMTNARVMGGESDGFFGVVISPLSAYDLLYDDTAGGIMDLSRSLSEKEMKKGPIAKMVTETSGMRVYQSTLVTAPSASKRRVYVFGKNGYAYTHFMGRMPQFGPNQLRNFNLIIHSAPEGSIQDPMGRIPLSMAYRFSLGVAFLDTQDFRIRTVDVDVSLAA